jgi:hypothetical protein
MSFDIPHMHFSDDSIEARAVEQVMDEQHLGPVEAIRSILRRSVETDNPALSGLGLFSSKEDAAALDAAVALAYEERRGPSSRIVA